MSDTVNSPVLINSSSNLETINNTIQVASSVSDIASRAISFTKKTWIDNADSGTPITAADMNRLEQAIVDLNTNIQSLQDSVSHQWPVGRAIWLTDAVTPQSLGLPGTWQSYRWSLTTNVGSVLDVKDGLVDQNGAQVQIYQYNATLSQLWHVYANGPGRVMLWVRVS